MIIESIRLENFRQFRGEHKIDFSVDGEKNVTVVMGENGSGKTTLEQAFTWCLYGNTTFKNSELINREVRNSLLVDETKQVKVELIVHTGEDSYAISRRHTVTRKSAARYSTSTEDFKVKIRNENGDWAEADNYLQAQSIVEEMLPSNLSVFFFFDGERIDKMSEDLLQKKKSKDFKEAVRALVGLNVLQAAMERFGPDNLKTTVTGKFIGDMGVDESGKLDEWNDFIDKCEIDIKEHKNQIHNLDERLEEVKKRIAACDNELKSMQERINNGVKVTRLHQKINDENAKKIKDEATCLQYFSKHSFWFLLFPLYLKALNELKEADKIDKGIPYIHSTTIEFLLKRGTCICGNKLQHNPECVKKLEDLMYTLPPHSLGTMIGNFVKDIKSHAKNFNDVGDHFVQLAQSALSHDERIDEYLNDLALLEKQLPDQNRVATIKQTQKELREQERKLANERDMHNRSIGSLEDQQKRTINKRNMVLVNSKRNVENRLYYEYAIAVYKELKREYETKEVGTRGRLEEVINEIFADIYDNQIGIVINNDYSISTYLTGNNFSEDELEKNTAQSYAVIFAFIAGIIKMHIESKLNDNNQQITENDGLPLVMDAPLSAFDKDRIKRICTELPQIAKQIIIFIKDTDGDIAEEHMSDVIGKKWLIQADSQTSSRIIERN